MLPFAIELNDGLSFGELIVGLGTLSLSCFTGWLGWETRASAKAAKEAVEASEEPFVIATPTDRAEWMKLRRPHEFPPAGGQLPPFEIHRAQDTDGSWFVRMKLWNIGSGPAIVRDVGMHRAQASYLDWLPRFHPIGAGQAVDL